MSNAAFVQKMGGHEDDVKKGKVACTHINDGHGEVENSRAETPVGDLEGKKGLTAE